MQPIKIWSLFTQSMQAWLDDDASSMGAALAYYTLFSIAPLLLIAIAVAGFFFGQEAARGEIVGQIQQLIGREGAIAVQGMLQSARDPTNGALASAAGLVALVVGATTVFAELQSDLDRIWRVSAPTRWNGLCGFLRSRMLSFGLVLGLGFLLLVSLLFGAVVAALGKWGEGLIQQWGVVFHVFNLGISFAVTTLLFALIYKLMPRTRLAWRDVWLGAEVAAVLFELGKFLIGLYLGKSAVASSFGAAGSLVVLLVWVYFSAQIFLLGAEFTRVYAHQYGSRAGRPAPGSAQALAAPGGSDPEQRRVG